jgi:ankyrin repeat protein
MALTGSWRDRAVVLVAGRGAVAAGRPARAPRTQLRDTPIIAGDETMRITGLRIACACTVFLLAAPPLFAAAGEGGLLDAVKRGDARAAAALVQQKADVNAVAADGTTALHWAAHRNDVKIADVLIRAGAKVRAANRYGVTPLALACEKGSAVMVDRLLEAGADANAAGADGETVLMSAARTGSAAVVAALLAHGADVRARERWRGQTALMWAAVENNAEAARALVTGGAEVSARTPGGFTPLLFAARGGHLAASRVLLDAGVPVDEALPDGTTALVMAVLNGHFELGALLLDRGANPNADGQGWTALHQVALTRNPNTGNNNPPAVPTGTLDSLDLVKRLVAHGANINAPLKKEPRDGYRQLLNRIGATPFLLAAKAADVDLMRVLLANGADPLQPTADHSTPLMVAAGVGIWNVGESPGSNEAAFEAVKLCSELGGDVTAANDNGYTALHGATHRGANVLIEWLVDKGARLDATITKAGGGNVGWQAGWTPLEIADGVFYANTFKRNLESAALLRRLMQARGMSTVTNSRAASAPSQPVAPAPR